MKWQRIIPTVQRNTKPGSTGQMEEIRTGNIIIIEQHGQAKIHQYHASTGA
jgi:hypothetical protein